MPGLLSPWNRASIPLVTSLPSRRWRTVKVCVLRSLSFRGLEREAEKVPWADKILFSPAPLDGLDFFSWLYLVVLVSGGQPNSCWLLATALLCVNLSWSITPCSPRLVSITLLETMSVLVLLLENSSVLGMSLLCIWFDWKFIDVVSWLSPTLEIQTFLTSLRVMLPRLIFDGSYLFMHFLTVIRVYYEYDSIKCWNTSTWSMDQRHPTSRSAEKELIDTTHGISRTWDWMSDRTRIWKYLVVIATLEKYVRNCMWYCARY